MFNKGGASSKKSGLITGVYLFQYVPLQCVAIGMLQRRELSLRFLTVCLNWPFLYTPSGISIRNDEELY
jgi:hypothetical protein